jgi:hypothetical protein
MPSLPEQVHMTRPRATVIGAWLEGWRRALGAPAVALAVWAITTVVALPLAVTLHRDIRSHLGASTVAEQAVAGWDADWTGEFAAQATGVATTFTREILGAAGLVSTLGDLLDGNGPSLSLLGAVALYLGISIFLSGGIVDRLARARPLGAAAFLALCGGYFFRLLRLSMAAGAVYWLLFRTVHPFLFDVLFDRWTRDLSTEHQVLAIRAGLYVVFAALMGLVSLATDFIRVRLVVEDRRSVVSAVGAGLRFVRRRLWRCGGLYILNILGQVLVARVWLQVASGAEPVDWLLLLLTQVYLVARIWARVAFFGSEVVFFQGELAHATYAAAPVPRWPDSASVEAVRSLQQR